MFQLVGRLLKLFHLGGKGEPSDTCSWCSTTQPYKNGLCLASWHSHWNIKLSAFHTRHGRPSLDHSSHCFGRTIRAHSYQINQRLPWSRRYSPRSNRRFRSSPRSNWSSGRACCFGCGEFWKAEPTSFSMHQEMRRSRTTHPAMLCAFTRKSAEFTRLVDLPVQRQRHVAILLQVVYLAPHNTCR